MAGSRPAGASDCSRDTMERSVCKQPRVGHARRWVGWGISSTLVWLLAAGCTKQQAASPAAPPAIPVRVAKVREKNFPVQVRAIGNVESYSTVSIKAQVSGEIIRVHFREGQDVRTGDPLFSIDPRPFEVARRQAEAALARDTALAENARLQFRRSAQLIQEGVISSQQNDQARTEAEAADAAVRVDQAAVERAKLDLQYTEIRSPIDGRTGSLMVHQGNLVKANENPALVVILQLNPIYVNFALPEQHLRDVRRFMAAGTLRVQAELPEVRGALSSGSTAPLPEPGSLSFLDNSVDSTTGTIRMKAVFANEQRRLWPGEFVHVVLTLSMQPKTIVVPTTALQSGQSGPYVFVVREDNTVESRPVVTGRAMEGDTSIEKGLRPGETVVTDGQLRLIPGTKVQVKG